jgi:D-3-phosphoglycerate dehydrogenase
MWKVLLCRRLHPDGEALLRARSDIAITQIDRPPPGDVLAAIPDADAVLVGLEPVNEAVLTAANGLRVVSRFGVGYDTIDVPACTRRGVILAVVNGANDLAVAEHAMMLLLAVARRTVELDQLVRAGGWMPYAGRELGELAGRRVLVVGYGRIGTRVARLCAAFGMEVVVHDPAFPTPRIAADGHTPAPDLMATLPEADVVTIHCPLNAETRHMIGREALALMKPTAWLINTARGPIVDEAALTEALASGKLEAAGLDVLEREPPAGDNPLLRLPNVVFSPHNTAASPECMSRMSIRAARNILEALDGTLDPGYVVNPEVLPARRNI